MVQGIELCNYTVKKYPGSPLSVEVPSSPTLQSADLAFPETCKELARNPSKAGFASIHQLVPELVLHLQTRNVHHNMIDSCTYTDHDMMYYIHVYMHIWTRVSTGSHDNSTKNNIYRILEVGIYRKVRSTWGTNQ